jgi:hypothetical protein
MGSKLTYILTAVLFMGSVAAWCQPNLPTTSQAIARVQEGDLTAAKELILQASTDPSENADAYTWYVKGFIFKEIYKQIEKANPYSENREVAIEAIKKSMMMDTEKKYLDNNTKAIEFLATSYYNDAVRMSRSLNYENINEPERFYARYKETEGLVHPGKNYAAGDIELYRNLARACHNIYDNDHDRNEVFFDRGMKYYEMALALKPDDYISNYNVASGFYNQGVRFIRKIDYDTEIFELILIQERCVALFKKALPYMQKAHVSDPKGKAALKGLVAIYKSLSDDAKAAEYQAELERLIKEGAIRE